MSDRLFDLLAEESGHYYDNLDGYEDYRIFMHEGGNSPWLEPEDNIKAEETPMVWVSLRNAAHAMGLTKNALYASSTERGLIPGQNGLLC